MGQVMQTQAKRLSGDIFNDAFITWINNNFDEFDAEFETYAALDQVQVHISLFPGFKICIK